MLPAIRCLLVPILAAAPACASSAILVNASARTWLIRPEALAGTPILLVLIRPGHPPETIRVGPGAPAPPDIELAPEAELRFQHGEGPGVAVSRWFEIETGDTTVEGYLHFHSDPALLGWGPDRTVLFGSFYATGRNHPFRFVQAANARVLLEPAAGLACAIL